jgi:hypothetical protein
VASKDLEKLCLNTNAFIISRNAWVFQNRGLVGNTDEAFAAARDDLRNSWRIISMNFHDLNMGHIILLAGNYSWFTLYP